MNVNRFFYNVTAGKIRTKVLEVDGVEIKNERGPTGPTGPTGITGLVDPTGIPTTQTFLFVNGLSTTTGIQSSTMDTTFMSPVPCKSVKCSFSRKDADEEATFGIIINDTPFNIEMEQNIMSINTTTTLVNGETKFQVAISSSGKCGGVIARMSLAP
jgi:hypothetical protein